MPEVGIIEIPRLKLQVNILLRLFFLVTPASRPLLLPASCSLRLRPPLVLGQSAEHLALAVFPEWN
jgi:hypothetical protein